MIERGHIGRAIQIVATNPFEFLFGGIVMGVLSLATLGLMAGPASGGIVAMALKRSRNEEIDVGDAFRGFENFTANFLVGLGLLVMILLGCCLFLFPGIVLAGLFGFALPAAVDRPITAGAAFKRARILAQRDLLAQAIFVAVVGALGAAGAVFLLIGTFVTMPIALTALTLAYLDAARPAGAPGPEPDF